MVSSQLYYLFFDYLSSSDFGAVTIPSMCYHLSASVVTSPNPSHAALTLLSSSYASQRSAIKYVMCVMCVMCVVCATLCYQVRVQLAFTTSLTLYLDMDYRPRTRAPLHGNT